MSETVRWIESSSWELPFFGLPQRIPWPADIDAAEANREPFEVDHLLRAIELLGPAAEDPWKSFYAASDHFADLIQAVEENEIGSALTALDEIENLLPETSFALFHRAYIARREGGDQEAIELYRAAAEKTPQVAAIWTNLGTLLGMRGERDEAIAAYRKALECKPNDTTALEGLTSLRELVKLKSADPRQPDAVRYVDVPTFRQLALKQIESITDAEQLFTYGDQLLRDGTAVDAALKAFERSCELKPGQPKSMHALAAAYRIGGQIDRARETMVRYTQLYPQDPNGYLHLAQICDAAKDQAAEQTALDQVLALDVNLQPAIAARFRLGPGEHDPAKEDELSKFAAEKQSWMAYILAATLARERGDHPSALRQVEKAYALNPEGEEVLLHYASSLAEMKELGKLASIVRPAVESGKYTKRLDWHYAHVLRQLNLTRDALEVLRKAVQGDVTDEFKRMVATTVDAWNGLLTGCGARLEVLAAGYLQRPILIALPDGDDGGVILNAGVQLPAEGKFSWRSAGPRTFVSLQQGESDGVRAPLKLGAFRIRAQEVSAEAGPIECQIVALPDGMLHFRAVQAGRKLEVAWGPKAEA
jgi:predicted Zn-dependent protease